MVLAKGHITITVLEDGFYTIRTAPTAVIIPANADGSNPILTGAKARVFVSKDGSNIPANITSAGGVGCTVSWSGNEVTITAISQGVQDGRIAISFTSEDGYSSSTEIAFLISKQGESGITIVLDNETHAIPARFDGSVTQAEIDTARTKISVFRGATQLTPVASNAVPGIGQFRYNVANVTGGTATRIDNSNVRLATMTAEQATISLNIYAERLENVYGKQMTITKVREGKEGAKGDKGALPLFRGEYNKDENGNAAVLTYVGNANRMDIVRLNGQHYFAKETAGTFNNISPLDPGQDKWDVFGTEVSSLATGLLLARLAYIENLVVRNIRTAGEAGELNRRIEVTSGKQSEWGENINQIRFVAPRSDYYPIAPGQNDYDVDLMLVKDDVTAGDGPASNPEAANTQVVGMEFKRPTQNANNDVNRVSGYGNYCNASGVSAIVPMSFPRVDAYGNYIGYLRRREVSSGIHAAIVGLLGESFNNCYSGYFNGKMRIDGDVYLGDSTTKGLTQVIPFVAGWTGNNAYWRNLTVKSGLIVAVGEPYYQ